MQSVAYILPSFLGNIDIVTALRSAQLSSFFRDRSEKKMDDEDFNVISQLDDAELAYHNGDENEPSVSGAAVVNALNETGQRKRRLIDDDPFKMPPDEIFTHPIDWHMRMPLTLEEHEHNSRKRINDDLIANRLLQRICQARAKRMRAARERFDDSEHEHPSFEDESQKEKQVIVSFQFCRSFFLIFLFWIMETPPIDGSAWLGVNSDENDERFYIRYLKKSRAPNAANERSNVVRMEILGRQYQNLKEEIEAVKNHEMQLLVDREERRAAPVEIVEENVNGSSMWINKYTPRTYTELLSDDGINRTLMSWMKLWDECVFKKKITNLPKTASVKDKDFLTLDAGKLRRPTHKIVLLSGPAGLGKTTLANVVARQAGYAVVELNASDSRNVPDFEKALEGAIRTSRTITQGNRPNCLILDEIDGAPVEAVRYLVKAVQAAGKKAIRRPIICICNNMYTSALRELRAIAMNIQVTATAKERLIQRLTTIAELEGIRVDRFALQRLVELCQCDVRFSINTLQFVSIIAKKNGKHISAEDIQKAVERERVGSTSIFENWSTMLDFTHHFDKKGVLKALPDRLRLVERVAIERGDDRFVSGLHANYLSVNIPLSTIRMGAEAFIYYDRIMLAINEKQDYVLMRYLPAFYMLLHAAVATHTRAKLKYPQLEQSATQKLRESQETLATVQSGLLTRHSPSALIYDVLPLVVQIVQPPIKAMNQQLYSSKELEQINGIVSTMADYHLTYAPTVVNFQAQYLFQPPVDILTMFPITDESSRCLLSNSVRQMIAHKITLFLATGKSTAENVPPKTNTAHIKEMVADAKELAAAKTGQMGPSRPLFYKYNTGCSTAVKRTIRMHQLLG